LDRSDAQSQQVANIPKQLSAASPSKPNTPGARGSAPGGERTWHLASTADTKHEFFAPATPTERDVRFVAFSRIGYKRFAFVDDGVLGVEPDHVYQDLGTLAQV
jgi:hypothetical protein